MGYGTVSKNERHRQLLIPNGICVGNLSRRVKHQRFEKLIIDSGFLILETSDQTL